MVSDPEHREVFDDLVMAWSETRGALIFTVFPSVHLSLLLVLVGTWKEIIRLRERLLEGKKEVL